MVSKSHKGHSGNIPTTSERFLWKSSPVARAEPRWRVTRVDLLSGAIIVAIAALALFGCSSSKEEDDTAHAANHSIARLSPEQCAAGAQIQAAGDLSGPEGSYLIQPGDQLSLEFYLSPEFNDEVTVRPDGKLTLRAIGDIKAWGLTPAQLAQELDKAYMSELRSPDAVVHVKNMPSREVYVQGQVNKPGAFPLDAGMTAVQAVSAAGGLTDQASDNAILIRRDYCGEPSGVRIDLARAMDHPEKGQDAVLMPRDVIVVPRSTIANVDLFVKQYIQGILPVPPYMSFPGPAL